MSWCGWVWVGLCVQIRGYWFVSLSTYLRGIGFCTVAHRYSQKHSSAVPPSLSLVFFGLATQFSYNQCLNFSLSPLPPLLLLVCINTVASIQKVKLPMNPSTFALDPSLVAKAINRNTVCVYASAPSFTHGVVDPVHLLGPICKVFRIHVYSTLRLVWSMRERCTQYIMAYNEGM